MEGYDHLVQFDSQQRELRIYRLGLDGKRELYTSRPLPDSAGWSKEVDNFARQLGENLLMDSPTARSLLKLQSSGS